MKASFATLSLARLACPLRWAFFLAGVFVLDRVHHLGGGPRCVNLFALRRESMAGH
jgi:hypothetical protein